VLTIDLLHYSIAISLTKPTSFQKKLILKDFLRWTDIWAFFYAVTELPQARKASLARFLEKRKDRYNISAQNISKKLHFCQILISLVPIQGFFPLPKLIEVC
jgi:hypothetical protein